MLSLKFDLSSFLELLGKLEDPRKIRNAHKRAIQLIVKQVHVDVKPKVPNDTGELYNSWKVEDAQELIEAGFDELYAMYQHQGRRNDGTRIIINRPAGGETYFLKKCIEENIFKYREMYEEEFFKHYLS